MRLYTQCSDHRHLFLLRTENKTHAANSLAKQRLEITAVRPIPTTTCVCAWSVGLDDARQRDNNVAMCFFLLLLSLIVFKEMLPPSRRTQGSCPRRRARAKLTSDEVRKRQHLKKTHTRGKSLLHATGVEVYHALRMLHTVLFYLDKAWPIRLSFSHLFSHLSSLIISDLIAGFQNFLSHIALFGLVSVSAPPIRDNSTVLFVSPSIHPSIHLSLLLHLSHETLIPSGHQLNRISGPNHRLSVVLTALT